MNNRFKFRVFDKETGKYYKTRTSKGSGCIVYQHPASSHYAWIQIGTLFAELEQDEKTYAQTGLKPDFIIEQCTGLKDKNGNPIYEGDVVKYYWDTKTTTGFICWNDDFAGFYIVNNEEHCIESPHCLMYVVNKKNIEIISNIHEQAEQKDVK